LVLEAQITLGENSTLEHLPNLCFGAHKDAHASMTKLEQFRLEFCGKHFRIGLITVEGDIAGLQVRTDLLPTQTRAQAAQVLHADSVELAQIDGSQKSGITHGPILRARGTMLLMRSEFQARLSDAAETFGTPLYAYDWNEIQARADSIWAAFGNLEGIQTRAFYAMKANPNLNLLRRLRNLNFGFEACSGGELERAILAGTPGSSVVMHGPGKLEADFVRALEVGTTVALDSINESVRIAKVAPKSRVLVRVNPGLRVSTHDHLATGNAESKFGVRIDDVPEAVSRAEKLGLEVAGLHMHIGSHIENPEDYTEALERVSGLAAQIGPREIFDMGGGFGLHFNLEPLAKLGQQAASRFQAKELWFEPGRFLVASSGALVVRVLEVKQTARKFAAIDAGMSELIRPMLYGAVHPVTSLVTESRELETVDLAGPACESGDVLARDVSLPSPKIGDLLAIGTAGAYGASMASNYLTRSRPAEVLLENDAWYLLRRRETVQEMLNAELGLD
jgi:diaminopimelate decarboxylase